jgi:hypothetical protein
VFAVLESKKLVRLLGEEKKGRFGIGSSLNGLDEAAVRAKLDKQGSMYAQADAFRIYRFERGKWAQLLIETVGSAAARQEASARGRDRGGEQFAGWLKSRQGQGTLPKRKDRDTPCEGRPQPEAIAHSEMARPNPASGLAHTPFGGALRAGVPRNRR